MIDEGHMLTGHAFNAMLKTLEEPPEYLKFVLATTDPQKVPVTVLSRCLQFNLRPMAPETVLQHLAQVLKAENVPAETQALRLISRAARGSMRDALSLTDQAIAFGGGQLQEATVRQMLGAVDRSYVLRLIDGLARGDGATVVDTIDSLRLNGLNAASTLEEMTGLLQRMAVLQAVPERLALQESDDPDTPEIVRLAHALPADETQLLYSLCLHGRAELGLAPDEYAALTMVLLRLLAFKPSQAATGAAAEKKTLKSGAEPPSPPVRPPVVAPPSASVPAPAVVAPAFAVIHRPVVPASAAAEAKPVPLPLVAPATTQRPVPVMAPAPTPQVAADGPDFENDDPPWVDEPEEPPVEEGVQTSRRVVAIPVRDPGPSQRLDQLKEPGEMVPVVEPVVSAEGDFWFDAVMQLVRAETITALVRELGLQSQLMARDQGRWLLRVERESLNQGNTRERLTTALQTLGHHIQLALEIGPVQDSASLRLAADAARRQREAEQIIRDDPFVQNMMRDFGGKIVPGTLKAITD
jgi:DNA polymerase-3 subunit gamma/tau